MSAEQQALRAKLDEVCAQIDEIRRLNPAVAEHLSATIDEARTLLTNAEQPAAEQRAEQDRSTADRLRDAVLEFEASHPKLANNLGSVIDALGQMGI